LIAALKREANKSRNNGIKFKESVSIVRRLDTTQVNAEVQRRTMKKSKDVNQLLVANIEFEDDDVDMNQVVKNTEWEDVARENIPDESDYVMIATIVLDETEMNHVTDFTYMGMLGDIVCVTTCVSTYEQCEEKKDY